jgi:hypothetical protein
MVALKSSFRKWECCHHDLVNSYLMTESQVKNTNKVKSCIDSVPKVSDILMTVVVVCFES